jgi:hypothetical protein
MGSLKCALAVRDVFVTAGAQQARVISFFTVEEGMIHSMVEFWPDSFPAAENRKHLVESPSPLVENV